MTAPAPIETDALVIGAGPVGLWQVFQLGLQGISCHVVDALPHAGGQLVELYPDKPIYDIPGLPVCSGRELAQRLQQQVQPFAPVMHLGQTVAAHDLCSSLRPYRKKHYMQAGVGHYGVFSGRRWAGQIYPLVRNTILANE